MTQPIRILIVEDDPITLAILDGTLQGSGFRTLSARSGEEALATLDAEGDSIDWLLTDIHLDGHVTGYSVGAEFQLRYPQRPVVYTSAAPLRTPALPSRSVCLAKPLDPLSIAGHFERLAREIEEAENAKQSAREAAEAPPDPATERHNERSAARMRSMLRGQIIYNNRFSTMDCVVRDMSETGARLELGGGTVLPPSFELYLPLRQKRYRVEMVWLRGGECGVRFIA